MFRLHCLFPRPMPPKKPASPPPPVSSRLQPAPQTVGDMGKPFWEAHQKAYPGYAARYGSDIITPEMHCLLHGLFQGSGETRQGMGFVGEFRQKVFDLLYERRAQKRALPDFESVEIMLIHDYVPSLQSQSPGLFAPSTPELQTAYQAARQRIADLEAFWGDLPTTAEDLKKKTPPLPPIK